MQKLHAQDLEAAIGVAHGVEKKGMHLQAFDFQSPQVGCIAAQEPCECLAHRSLVHNQMDVGGHASGGSEQQGLQCLKVAASVCLSEKVQKLLCPRYADGRSINAGQLATLRRDPHHQTTE